MTREMPNGPIDPTSVFQIKTHGGLGDIVWAVAKKAANADKPIFLHISEENRARPRRSGILADHLPNVAGWRFDTTTFCPGGQDWGPPEDPACAIGKTWAEIAPAPGQILRLECNKHLEAGGRIEEWLSDLPTTHHFDFLPSEEPPRLQLATPYVLFHMAGWPDILDDAWVRLADRFNGYANVYIVGGTYDVRPQRMAELLSRKSWVSLLTDLGWSDLISALKGAAYCFGHASGFTALADVLKVPGVVCNPRQHPRLLGTWNSLSNPDQVHCQGTDFEAYVTRAFETFVSGGSGSWPPDCPAAARITANTPTPQAAVKAVTTAFGPDSITLLIDPDSPPDLPATALNGAFDSGHYVSTISVIGGAPAHVAGIYAVSIRSSRPPIIVTADTPTTADHAQCVVVWAKGTPVEAYARVRDGWKKTAARGVMVVVGPNSGSAIRSLGAGLRTEPAAVRGCPDAYYLVRRV